MQIGAINVALFLCWDVEIPWVKAHMGEGGAGWSSPVARQAHNLKAAGSNPAPATNFRLASDFRISYATLLIAKD